MRVVYSALAVLILAAPAWAQAPITPGVPPPQVVPPVQTAPSGQTVPPPAPGQPAAPPVQTAPVAPMTRTFSTKSGMIFNTVRADRVKDFETVLSYLQQALEKSTDATVRAQAAGWRIYRATEPGPNASVLYIFVLDPAVPSADYGLGRILADAYPEQIEEIWRLYQGSVTGGGSLMNLTPVEPAAPAPSPAAAPPAP